MVIQTLVCEYDFLTNNDTIIFSAEINFILFLKV